MRATVADALGKAFAPDRIVFVDALPKTRSAKIVRRAVRATALGEDPGDLSSVENPEALAAIAPSYRLRVENLCGWRLPRSTPSSATSTRTAIASCGAARGGPGRGRRSRRLSRAGGDRLSARGSAPPPTVPPRGRASARGDRSPGDRHRRPRRHSARRGRSAVQRLRRLLERRGAGRLPQAPAPELRRLRRGALLRAGWRDGRARPRRRAARPDRLRGPLGARPAGDGQRCGGRDDARQPIGVAVPRRRRTASASRCSPSARAQTAARSSSATRSADRTSSCSTGTRSSSTLTERSSPVRPASRRRCSSSSATAPLRSGAPVAPQLDDLEQMRRALELGLRDYVEKNGFSRGRRRHLRRHRLRADRWPRCRGARRRPRALRVDAVAVLVRRDAIGRARRSPARLGIDFREISIDAIVAALEEALAPSFDGLERDATEENLQARVRGTLLMALSNKHGWLLVATGNKSELSVGYATLYGDMAGGFALLKDVYKTDVWRLARHMNERAGRELIPTSVIERAPSAELAPGPAGRGLAAALRGARPRARGVRRARPLPRRAARGRLRSPRSSRASSSSSTARSTSVGRRHPASKLRPKAFGRDRRTPITNRWRD